MLDWLRRKKQDAPLTGAPRVRRQKTYSAGSGYVYQYFYAGHRAGAGATEYVFEVSSDRRTNFPVSVLLESTAVEAWEGPAGRRLRDNERYAIAKLALFQAFDERPAPADMKLPVRVRAADVALILERLGF